ncbi:MAG: Sec-independent protein translocase protein TatB [Magnetovibrionaceae bacterium]
MFDIGWQEIFIISVLALLVVGPKELPRMLKTIMAMVKKARGLAGEFQTGINDLVREAELEDLKKQIQEADKMDLNKKIKDTVDPSGALEKDLDMTDIQKNLDTAAKDAAGRPKAKKMNTDAPTSSKSAESKPAESTGPEPTPAENVLAAAEKARENAQAARDNLASATPVTETAPNATSPASGADADSKTG